MNEEMNYIEISDKYRITWDSLQFILHQKRKVMDRATRKYTNEERFAIIGYYTSIEGCLRKIINLELKKNNKSTLNANEVLSELNKTYDMIHSFLSKFQNKEFRRELIKIEKK